MEESAAYRKLEVRRRKYYKATVRRIPSFMTAA